jgi:hypothetical protein
LNTQVLAKTTCDFLERMPSKRREFSLSGELKVSDVVEVSFLNF